MKLEARREAMLVFTRSCELVNSNSIERLDFKPTSQIVDASQSLPSNIAEGYCRRTINEYLQYLDIALGSSGGLMTRVAGLVEIGLLYEPEFAKFDVLYNSLENKLIALVKSLQLNRRKGEWLEEVASAED